MNWRSLLTSPPPDAVWSIDQEIAVISRRDRGGVFRCAATEMGPGVVDLGTVGLQAVDATALAEILRTLHTRVASTSRPAVVIPTGWARCFLIEGTDLPRRRSDLDDVLRWRLKKLLPVPPSRNCGWRPCCSRADGRGDDRSCVPPRSGKRPSPPSKRRFRGVRTAPRPDRAPDPGAGADPGESDRLVVEQDVDVVALAVVASGGIRFLRTKPLPKDRAAWPDLARELDLTVNYIRDSLGITGPLEARCTARDPEVQQLIGRHLQEVDGLGPVQPSAGGVCPDAAIAHRLGPGRLTAMAAIFEEGYPQ
jgi:hypothetical protein